MRALVCGVSGQDGAYLARLLMDKGYEVWGTSRDAQVASFKGLEALNLRSSIVLRSMAPNDFRSVFTVVSDCAPDEIYFLAGQSSVGLSFDQPAETLESISLGTLNILEAIRLLKRQPIRLYNASSSECFGEMGERPASESTPFAPRSPYAVAKASSHWLVANYREAYGLYACNGILFNHESPLRPARFVTRKIVAAACDIANGANTRLALGRLDIVRDWGWAPEYVEAMWRMLQCESPRDYVIATGEANSLEAFVEAVFSSLNLDWKEHVDIDATLLRPSDLTWSQGNPDRARRELQWTAEKRMREVAHEMVTVELASLNSERVPSVRHR
jgi:GDPmannose 4,6-dehydratase